MSSDNAPLPGIDAILGLLPDPLSGIFDTFHRTVAGETVLSGIFRQAPTLPRYVTLLLSRPNEISQSLLTIGELVPTFDGVESAPRLEVPKDTGTWQTTLDANGIFGPNGRIKTTSQFNDESKLVVVFDSGVPFSYVSPH